MPSNQPISHKQVLEIYLEIQAKLGVLVEEAPQPAKGLFKRASTDLLRAKREWIGEVNELTGENIAYHGRKVSVAVE